jgi:purine-binding chemotaxis protein CheW
MATNPMDVQIETATRSRQFSTFYLADLFFGLDVLHVQEVMRYQPMTPVPRAPQIIEGLINLRGQIVIAIDMRRRLGLPARPEGKAPIVVVVRTADGAVSLLVDEIGDVMEIEESLYEPPPVSLAQTAREVIRGVYKLKDQLLLILDEERTADVAAPA